ncbi:hypothetical protein KSF_088030 [Reticulibacter mediterranei]|uniref:Uncharacterized protein n=1 Tax=Reticulibacter mediterranei TaxID=2778369 RepID=A0A8J3N7R3_9CHLR|nr:hypothetical protein KSF_088030 [Reticulibacter mediterranei]
MLVTVSSLAQGIEVVRQWWIAGKTTQGVPKQQGSFPPEISPSSATDIVAIRLWMAAGSDHECVEWLTDPDRLKGYLDAFQKPDASLWPLHAVFVKRNGDEVKANVLQESGNDQRETFLSYLQGSAMGPANQASSCLDWRMLVKEEGNDLLVGEAALPAIIQGLRATEEQWRRQQEQKRQGHPRVSSEKDITDICLVHKSNTRQWIADPDTLNKQMKALMSTVPVSRNLSHAIFLKREGRTLVMNVTNEKQTHQQPNVILKYLEADPQ